MTSGAGAGEARASESPGAPERRAVANRLKRAEGQLRSLVAAVERGDDCRTIVTQLAAVSSALDRAGFLVVSNALRECLARPDQAEPVPGELTAEEIERLFLSLA